MYKFKLMYLGEIQIGLGPSCLQYPAAETTGFKKKLSGE